MRWRRDKVGHNVPTEQWSRHKEWQNAIGKLLSKSGFVNIEIYGVKAAKQIFSRSQNGENHSMFLWQFINIHLWYEQVFTG